MSKIMRTLAYVDFDGIAIPVHIPALGAMPVGQAGRGGGGANTP